MTVGFFVLALVCVAGAALLAAGEAAVSSVSHHQVADAVAENQRGAAHVARILDDLPTHVNVLTFLRQFFEAMGTVFVAMAYMRVLGVGWQMVLFTVLTASIAMFVIAGVSPRTIGRRRSLSVSLGLGWLITGLRTGLGPVARVLVWLGNMLTPAKVFRDGPFVTEEQLRDLVDRSEVIEEEERDMIQSVFNLGDTRAHRVMVPRPDLVTVASGTTLPKAMSLFLRSGFSRVPVVGEDVDDVLGLLYLKDVARRLHTHPGESELTVDDLARPLVFVPETKPVDELLRQMQLESRHVAVVIDEYGGVAGIVTIEDIVEEIVGEIDDEHDQSDEDIVEQEPGVFRVSSRMQIEDLAEHFDVRIEDETVSTVGGLLAKEIGRVPIEGSTAVIAGLRLQALPGQGRRHRITHLTVTREEDGAPS
ncbi:hemolysin family protein [Brevibacterium daeguense]|uniref:Hemolysin family protein n=1 Tax=Brevibacterium daeguense TaxID=909936 RepID=A0ABP8EN93_9MICO